MIEELKERIQQSIGDRAVYEEERKKVTVVSYSQLKKYMECPHSWELAYAKKLKIYKPSIHTLFGTAMHETIQHFLLVASEETIKKANEINLPKYLLDSMMATYKSEEEIVGESLGIDPETLHEFWLQGVSILDYVRKKRSFYFGSKRYELLGIETPLYLSTTKPNIKFISFLDLVFYDKVMSRVKIVDIKTSTKGWSSWAKKDDTKKAQVVLYKHFFSQKYDVPFSDVDVEFFIVKRTLYEDSDWPQKRVQLFTPAQGTVTMKRFIDIFNDFIDNSFTEDGGYNLERVYPAIEGENGYNCKFCEYNNDEFLCPKGKRVAG